jgi:polyisoprenoid-binding protein YceI
LTPAAFTSAAVSAQTYRIEPGRTSAGFAVMQLGIARQTGQFGRASGTIELDPSGYGGSIDVSIDTASVDTGWGLRDKFLRGEHMFDVARFPIMRFRSTHLEYSGRQIVGAQGMVTLHGVTRPVRLDVTRLACGIDPAEGREGCGATVTGRLKRRDFGMEFAFPLIGDDVELDFSITAFRAGDGADAEAR